MLELIQRNQAGPAQRGLHLYDKYADPPEFVSYQDFPASIAGYAEFFRERGIGAGTRVLFPFETSTPAIFAFLALMELGALPLSVKPLVMNTPKVSYQEFLGRITREFGAEYVLGVPSVTAVDLPAPVLPLPPAGTSAPGATLRVPADDELAFVQFSSGSTSFPKGVPVTQAALRGNLAMITRTDLRVAGERVCSWLPLYHDMGLVGGMLSSVVIGNDLLLAEPITFLADVLGFWEHMSRERSIGTVIPNFAVDYSLKLMADLDPEEIAALDLSAVRAIYLGSEPINIPNLTAFLDLMAPAGLAGNVFMPCYGMAEVVLLATSCAAGSQLRVVSSPAGMPAISVGTPMPEFTMRLRAEDGRICGDNEFGEVELAGGTLAASYFEKPEPLAGADGFYATGDIGFTDGGELFITGRISDRIKVNGQSLFAADFEQAAERLPFVRDGRVAVLQVDGRILVLTEIDRQARADVEGSRAAIVAHLVEELGVTVLAEDVHFLKPGQLPRTSSGKLQRRAVEAAYRAGTLRGITLGSANAQA